MRVLGLWLKYLFFGVFITVAALGTADVPGVEEPKETRFRTQVVGGISGFMLLALALGLYLQTDASADPDAARELVLGAGSLFVVTTLISWWMISADLRRKD